jgi:hypothetical protein
MEYLVYYWYDRLSFISLSRKHLDMVRWGIGGVDSYLIGISLIGNEDIQTFLRFRVFAGWTASYINIDCAAFPMMLLTGPICVPVDACLPV